MPHRLESEVWALDRCCGCGNCVALCSKGVLFWGTDQSPAIEKREKALGLSHTTLDTCSFCQRFCEEGCPRLVDEWPSRQPRQVVAVRTRGLVQSGDPSDVVKHLLVAGLSSGLIDGAVLSDTDPWTLQPVTRSVTTVGEIMDTLGISYLWSPTLSALNEAVFEKGLRELAVVGTPCVSQGLSQLASSGNTRLAPYQQAVRLSISLFCTGVYLPELVNGFLVDEMGLPLHSIRRLEALPRDEALRALLWDGSSRDIRQSAIERYTRHGCARCDDYLGESADVSVGAVGAPEGYCSLIVRSQAGEICLRNALGFGLLEVSDQVDLTALRQAREEKERRQRAQAFDRLMVMMLDALAEPRHRAEVKQAFVRLYEVKKPASQKREEASCHATCGEC